MIIHRKSPHTGKMNTMDLPITPEQILAYERGTKVQDAFPHLTPEQREFILTGYTPEDWNALFPPEEEDEEEDEEEGEE